MKIIILENQVKNDAVIKSGIAQAIKLCQTIGLTLDVTYKTTNLTLTTTTLNTDVVSNGVGINYKPILDSVDGTEDIACMIYNADNLNPKPTNPNSFGVKKGNCTPMQIPEFWYGGYDNVLAEFFLHELCHCMYFLTRTSNDQTHFKYLYPQFSQKSNIDFYLFLIKSLLPNWNSYSKQIVMLKREADDGVQTIGELAFNGFSCRTLERPFLNNQQNISCIPKETYNVKWTFSRRLLRYTYEIQNVPNRSGIRIHSSNFFRDLNGCIALGDSFKDIDGDSHLDILNSRKTIQSFETLMNKRDFTLKII